jgi:hypothetical protein
MAMTREQRQLALAIFDAGMSERGASQARWSIALDDTLREHERADGHVIESVSWRDSELYWFSIFGDPVGAAPWAWRAGGHVERSDSACT